MSCFFTIDFGVNYANKKYPQEKLTRILQEAYDAGVGQVVCISNSIDESKINLNISQQHVNLYYTIGCHPHNAKNWRPQDVEFLEKNVLTRKCFGIGECGLDFNRNFSTREQQMHCFEQQILLAKKLKVKLYLHCRDAYIPFINLLKQHEYYNGIIHCFTMGINEALELQALGFKLGITGWLLDKRRNADLKAVVQDPRILLDTLIVETDAPFMPINNKSESAPQDTGFIVFEIARLRGINAIECGQIIHQNSINFLQI